MNKARQIAMQHPESVAFVFRKYGVRFPVTPRSLAIALIAAKERPEFYIDLNNAIIKRSVLKHNNFEDDFNYYIVDKGAPDDFDADETVFEYYEIEYDNAKGKERRAAKKVKRREKKAAKKSNKQGANAPYNIEDAAIVSDTEGTNRTGAEKAELATGIIGNVLNAAGGIMSSVSGFKNNSDSDSTTDVNSFTSAPGQPQPTGNKYLPYIIGGVVLVVIVGGLIFFLKRKK